MPRYAKRSCCHFLMPLTAKQDSLIDDLNGIHDAHERLGALSSFIPQVTLPQDEKTDDLLVRGCVSRVWVKGWIENQRTYFRCAADSPMVLGLVAVLCSIYNDCDPAEVATVEPKLWDACGFTKILSPTRLNGLTAVRNRIREIAQAS